MKASISNLGPKSKDILAALNRNEEVTLTYRGKVKAVIKPMLAETPAVDVGELDYFGIDRNGPPVEEVMKTLRGGRYRDL